MSKDSKDSKYIGKTFTNSKGHRGVVLDVIMEKDKRNGVDIKRSSCTMVLIRFESGFEEWFVLKNVNKGIFKDYGQPTKYGGYSYRGAYNKDKKVYDMWQSMLKRCYKKDSKDYPRYGGRGVVVSEDWKHLKVFEEEIKTLEGYDDWIKNTSNYSLDKDSIKKENKVYCKEFCKFSDNIEQSNHRNIVTPVESIDEFGNIIKFMSIGQASRELGLNPSRVRIVAEGAEWQQTGGYRFRISET